MIHRILIVEDDLHQQQRILSLLKLHDDIKVSGVASTVSEAKGMITGLNPDLVFLDVMLPPQTCFDLLAAMSEIKFEIIFTTSYEEFAVKAFRLSAIDYLLKPLVAEELDASLEKFRQKKGNDKQVHNLMSNLARQANPKIALPTMTGFLFVPVKEIVRCESDNTYTTFLTLDKKKIIVSKTLKDCEQMLSDYRFFRVHNSHLINLDFVVEYIKGEGGMVKMVDGGHVDVSRRRKEEFLRILRN